MVAVEILLVEFPRVLAYFYFLRSNYTQEIKPRLIMFVTRLCTTWFHIGLLVYGFYILGGVPKNRIIVLLANLLFIGLDTYFLAVLFSYYKVSPQE